MRVLISGAGGLVGTELIKQLKALGHEPIALVRREATGDHEISWKPGVERLDPEIMESIDAVVNLGGATTGRIPWTKNYMQTLISSRLDTTKTLVEAINASKNQPKVLVSGSASGIYGDRGDEVLDETAGKGEGFLSDLASAWEAEAQKANTRVVLARTTLVMSKKLGALGRLLPLIKAGIGGPLGSGNQWWAWISLEDEARAIIHLIDNDETTGAYNLTAPEPATCKEMVVALGKALKRPTFFRVPSWAMRLLIGVAADELLLCSQKMTATKLLSTGFEFNHPTLKDAVDYVVS
ncbi:MAG: TIGR01777 family protein [Micrococcales bacterium]|nr:TIGR01777 family protein [Micrococcales bacterium]